MTEDARNGYPLIPIGFIKTRTAVLVPGKMVLINSPLLERDPKSSRTKVSSKLDSFNGLGNVPVINERATIEFYDNRISLFIAQKGKCAVLWGRVKL